MTKSTIVTIAKYIFTTITSLTICSCATILNAPSKNVRIATNKPASIIYNSDTLTSADNKICLNVLRQKKPLIFKIFDQNLSKEIYIDSKFSAAFWANFATIYPVGFVIDAFSPKQYTFPRNIFVDMNSSINTYSTIDTSKIINDYIIKITPFKLSGIDNPGLEIACEKRTSKFFSTQAMVSYLFIQSIWESGNSFNKTGFGYRAAIEEKYYLVNNAPIGLYTSLEFNYMNKKYTDVLSFGDENLMNDTIYDNDNYLDIITLKKQTFSINLKLGYQLFVDKFTFDCFVGFGYRYKNVEHFDRRNINDYLSHPIDIDIGDISTKKYKGWTLSLPLNFRVGWTF